MLAVLRTAIPGTGKCTETGSRSVLVRGWESGYGGMAASWVQGFWWGEAMIWN